MTSANVISMSTNRIADAAMPSAASMRSSQAWTLKLMRAKKRPPGGPAGGVGASGLVPPGRALELRVKLLQEHCAIHIALLFHFLDPSLDDRLRFRLDVLYERGIRGLDLHACFLHALVAEAVDVVPGFAGAAGEVFAAELGEHFLVGLGELVPLVLVDEEAERGAVKAAGEQGGVLDQAVELERHDRFLREEHAIGDAGAQ